MRASQDINFTFEPMAIITKPGGFIFHGMTAAAVGYEGFGELYFSSIEKNCRSDWKLHKSMTLNLMVPCGNITIYLRHGSEEEVLTTDFRNDKKIKSMVIGVDNYGRLTVPPGIWVCFEGMEQFNLLANLANVVHDPNEFIRLPSSQSKPVSCP